MTTFRVHALPPAVLEDLRSAPHGGAVAHVVAGGGEPVRCCLRDASPGDELLLCNYEPPLPAGPSPYREVGAVYVHAHRCAGPDADAGYPADWYGRAQVLRAYDERGWIHPATRVHDGSAPEAVIGEILAEPDVVLVHSRNVAYGCYMFSVTR